MPNPPPKPGPAPKPPPVPQKPPPKQAVPAKPAGGPLTEIIPFAVEESADAGPRSTPTPIDEDNLPEIPGLDLVVKIGQGGMGEVFEAQQRSTGRRVAVKIL